MDVETRMAAARRLFDELFRAGFNFGTWPGALLLCPELVRVLDERHLFIRPAQRLTDEQRAAVGGDQVRARVPRPV